MRKEYELSEDQLERLLDAGRPVMCIKVGDVPPRSQQENANDAWRSLGREMGFVWDTAEPVAGKGQGFITAIAAAEKKEAE